MPTLTIRNVPDDVVQRLKAVAKRKGHSMEQEVRELLEERYANPSDVIARIKKRWNELPPTSAAEVDDWIKMSRPNRAEPW